MESPQRAVAAYPAPRQPGSPINARFVNRYALLKAAVSPSATTFSFIPGPGSMRASCPSPCRQFIDEHRELLRPILDFLLGRHVQVEARTFNERFGLLEDEPHVHLRLLDDALRVASGHPVLDATLPVGALRGLALRPTVIPASLKRLRMGDGAIG